MLVDENCLLSNVPPGAGRKLDTIYNKTLSILCHTPCNLCTSPININSVPTAAQGRHNHALVPMKLNLENKKVKYEVCFDYDIKKDTEQGVAVELRKALDLPEKYEKRITKAIKMLLREKIVMIEMLLLMNKQNRNLRYQQFRSKNAIPCARQESDCSDESKEIEHANSFNRFLDEKLQIWRLRKRDFSFEKNHMKLLGRSHSNLSYINKEDINSRRSNLNATANEKYKA